MPWNKDKDDLDADGDIPEDNCADAQACGDSQEVRNDLAVVIRTREVAPRVFYIRSRARRSMDIRGVVGGCSSWFRGLGRQPLSEKCRDRFMDLMKDEANVINSEKRKVEFDKKMVKKAREKLTGKMRSGTRIRGVRKKRWRRIAARPY